MLAKIEKIRNRRAEEPKVESRERGRQLELGHGELHRLGED
jgi:hypothetical protein